MTRAPAAASATAVARPMPRGAPVTKAILLARLVMAVLLEVRRRRHQASSLGMKMALHLPLDKDFVCSSYAFKVWIDHGIAAFALFHRGGRGGQPHQCGRAAAAHRAAVAQPANPRS